MATPTFAPFGTYVFTVDFDSLAGSKVELQTALQSLRDLIPEPNNDATTTIPANHPDFDMIPAGTAALLRAEIDALDAVIQAT